MNVLSVYSGLLLWFNHSESFIPQLTCDKVVSYASGHQDLYMHQVHCFLNFFKLPLYDMAFTCVLNLTPFLAQKFNVQNLKKFLNIIFVVKYYDACNNNFQHNETMQSDNPDSSIDL